MGVDGRRALEPLRCACSTRTSAARFIASGSPRGPQVITKLVDDGAGPHAKGAARRANGGRPRARAGSCAARGTKRSRPSFARRPRRPSPSTASGCRERTVSPPEALEVHRRGVPHRRDRQPRLPARRAPRARQGRPRRRVDLRHEGTGDPVGRVPRSPPSARARRAGRRGDRRVPRAPAAHGRARRGSGATRCSCAASCPRKTSSTSRRLADADLEPLARHLGALLGAAHRRGAKRLPRRPWNAEDRAGLLARAIALAGAHESMYLAYCDQVRR